MTSRLPVAEEKRRMDMVADACLRIAVAEQPFIGSDMIRGLQIPNDSQWANHFYRELVRRGYLTKEGDGATRRPFVYTRTPKSSEPLLDRGFVAALLWPGTYGAVGDRIEGALLPVDGEVSEETLTQPGSAMEDEEAGRQPSEPREDPMLSLLASFRDHLVAQGAELGHLRDAVKQLPEMMAEAIGAAIEDVMARQPPPALPAPDAAAETVRGMLASTNERVTKLEARIVGNTAAINEAAAVGEKIWKRANVVAERINSLDGNIETMGKLLLVLVDHKNMPTSATMPMNLGVLSAIRNGDVKPEPAPTKKAAGK